MAKVIISAQKQTNQIIEKLKDNVGGMELIGCLSASDIKKAMLSSGKVSKVIIFDNALDLDEIDFLAEQPSITTILVLKTEDRMKKFDIKYFIKDNVNIVDFRDKTLNLLFIKNLITKPVDKSILYSNKLHRQEAKPTSIDLNNTEEDGPKIIRRATVEEEDEEVKDVKTSETDNKPKLETLIRPKREINLKREQEIITPVAKAFEDSKDKLKRTVDLFRDGCVIGVVGLPKSYSSTTTLNMARSSAESGLTTLIIDTDFVNLPFSSMTDRLFRFYLDNQEEDFIMNTLRGDAVFKNVCLYDTNLHILSNSLISDPLDASQDKNKNLIKDLLSSVKKIYNTIFIDIRCEDIANNINLLKSCNRIVFNIPMTEKDLIYFMRHVETLDQDMIKLVFGSNYIAVNQENRNLLGTKYGDLAALDEFLGKNFSIVNREKYGNIERVGEVIKEKDEMNFMNKDRKLNGDYYRQILLNILE